MLTVSTFLLHAQEKGLILSHYYSPKDYNAGTQNWCVTQDSRGVLYFGNAQGILEYDGVEWRLITVANNSSVRSLEFDHNNILYSGAYGEIGYLTPNSTGNLVYNSLNSLIDSSHLDFGEIWDIRCYNDSIFFLSDKYIFRYHNNKFDYWESKNERFYLSHKIGNSYLVQEMGKGLMIFEKDSLILIDKGEFFSDKRIHSILPLGDNLLICTRTEGLYTYNIKKNGVQITSFDEISEKTRDLNRYFIENIFYHGIEISDSTFALSTLSGNIILIDKNWDILDVITNESIGIKSSIHYLFQQKDNSLWLALGNGISQLEILSPYRYWNDNKGINGNFSDVARINEYLYVSTHSGVYYINSEDLSKFEISSFSPVDGVFEMCWGFLYFQPPKINGTNSSTTKISNYFATDETILLVSSTNGLFEIKKDKSELISKYKSIYLSYQYKKDPSILFLGLDNGIAMLRYKNGKWKDLGPRFGIESMIRDIKEDTLGNLWLTARYKGIYKIEDPLNQKSSTNHVEFFDTTNSCLPSVSELQIVDFHDTLYFASKTNFYTYNHEKRDFDLYKIPDEISNVEINDGLKDTLSEHRINEDRLTEYYITTLHSPILWFGSTKGTFRYDFKYKRDLNNVAPTIIRKVLANDSIIYHGTNYTKVDNFLHLQTNYILNPSATVDLETILEYKNNSFVFFFSNPFFEEVSKNSYSYYLSGFDNKWSEWTTEHKKEYTNLREGEYIFLVKSRNIYDIETPVAEFKFTILAPWYRTFKAYLGYIILGIILIVFIVRLYTIRLIKEKDKLEKIVIERTQEILMQKEEILVQAEHLKDANERITAKNEELEKQKWEITNQALKLKRANVELIKLSKVASETDNAIAIFDKEGNIEWVNDGFTRMYGYSVEQYKKEKNGNIIDGSDNPNIQEAVKLCLSEKKSVVYEFKTKTRDGKELWAQTTLTHVIDKNGETINLIAIDSDITKIKLAEKEIAEQRDKLALSNATKNKFFRIIAHDLRNPISTLAGSTNLIFNDFDEYNKEETKMFIGELNKLSQTTFNLLENLLDWSSTQMGEIKFSPKVIDLESLTSENIELIKRKIDSKNIKLETNVKHDCSAFADENMVKTVIRNLLSNAVKFTPENGHIEITCNELDNYIKYTVKDSGIGISPEDQKKLFRIDTHHTTPGLSNEKGSGLGLILCKEFIEKNEGEINIFSQANQGTTIEFTLKKQSS